MPSLRSTSGCGPTSNSYPALSRLFVEHIDPCCNDCDLTIGDNNIVVNTKDNRVGINTQFPTEALDVNGNIYVSGDVSSKTASFYGDSTPGSTTLKVTGNAGFYGDITSISQITAGTKLYSQGTIESTGEAKVGSLKVLGVSNLDGNLNVPAGNITCGGTGSFTGVITSGGNALSSAFKYAALSMNSGTTVTQTGIGTTFDSIDVVFWNMDFTTTTVPTIQIGTGATPTYVTSNYIGGTAFSSAVNIHSTDIPLWNVTTVNTDRTYSGKLTFDYVGAGGGHILYYYRGEISDSTGLVSTISGRVNYNIANGRITAIKLTTGGLSASLSYMKVTGFTY